MKIRNIYLFILFCLVADFGFSQSITLPKPSQVKWHEAEMGAVFHYDLHVFDGKRYNQTDNRINPIEDYNIFHPSQLNTNQWVQAAKAAGCKFALITATHETGFGLWQSDVNPYCMKALKFQDGKGDIVRDFVNSCRKYGLQPGIYVGIRWNSYLGIHNFSVEGKSDFAKNRQEWYKRYCEKMVTELCTRYGKLFMIWFDGGADDPKGIGPDVEPIVNKYQPDCLFYHNVNRADLRWGGSESGKVGYPCWSTFPVPSSHNKSLESNEAQLELLKHGDKDGKYWVPAMADTPLRSGNGRHEWFWEPDDDNAILSLDELMDKYDGSVGRNATLMIGLTPDPAGLIPAPDVKRLQEWGMEIQHQYGKAIAQTSGMKKVLSLSLENAQEVNTCIIQENIAEGERIRQYQVQAKVNGRWVTVCSGQSVGHKRIEHFPSVRTSSLRLVVTACIAQPDIINFSIFNTKLNNEI
jgi:alpha-L-fucosidase